MKPPTQPQLSLLLFPAHSVFTASDVCCSYCTRQVTPRRLSRVVRPARPKSVSQRCSLASFQAVQVPGLLKEVFQPPRRRRPRASSCLPSCPRYLAAPCLSSRTGFQHTTFIFSFFLLFSLLFSITFVFLVIRHLLPFNIPSIDSVLSSFPYSFLFSPLAFSFLLHVSFISF